MARIPMVTRTLTTTKVNVLCLNTETCEPENRDFTLMRTYADDKSIMKAIEKLNVLEPEVKAVKVVSVETVETRYGMTEVDFMAVAKVLTDADEADSDSEADQADAPEVAEVPEKLAKPASRSRAKK